MNENKKVFIAYQQFIHNTNEERPKCELKAFLNENEANDFVQNKLQEHIKTLRSNGFTILAVGDSSVTYYSDFTDTYEVTVKYATYDLELSI